MIIRVDVSGTRLDDLPVRGQRSVLRNTMREMLQMWSELYLPKHFEEGNRRRYGYKPRSRSTQRRKRRLALYGAVKDGGRVDLVWTGLTRTMVMRSRFNIKAFPTRARVRLRGPAWFRIRYRYGHPKLQEEVTVVTPAERRRLARHADRVLESEIKKWIRLHGTKKLNKVRT